MPLQPGRRGDPRRPARGHRVLLARVRAAHQDRAALRVPRPRAVGPQARPAVQPRQAPARPLRQGRRRVRLLEPRGLRPPGRRPVQDQPHRQRAGQRARRRHDRPLRLGQRPPPPHAVGGDHRLRAARQGLHRPPPGRARGAARHLLRPGPPRGGEAPRGPGRDRGRAHAGAPVRARRADRLARAEELLGVQLGGVLRAAQRVRRGPEPARGRGARVQAPRQDAARRRHRGHHRRGLQPHGRGQPPRAHAVLPRLRQPGVLPPRRRQARVLRGLHRVRQQPEHAPPAGAPAHHGLAAVLGH